MRKDKLTFLVFLIFDKYFYYITNFDFRVVAEFCCRDDTIALVTDMLDASTQLLDAELKLVNARINVIFNYYKLKNTSGFINYRGFFPYVIRQKNTSGYL